MSLPKGYKRLEWIQSTGEQHIDTLLVPDANTKVVVDFMMTNPDDTNQAIFGVADGSGQFGFRWYGTSSCFRTNGASSANFPTEIDGSARHIVEKTATVTIIDNIYSATTSVANVSLTLYLFAQHIASGASNNGKVICYSCQYYSGDVLVRDYIPCETDTGDVGLWDNVNSVFYGNAGTGAFIAGPEVIPPIVEPTFIDYRTAADVARVKALAAKGWQNMTEAERDEYLNGIDGVQLGSYGADDMNRVGNAQAYLRELFNAFPNEISEYLENAKEDVFNSLTANSEHYQLKQPLIADEYKEVSYAYPIALEDIKLNWTRGDYPASFTNETERVYDITYYLTNLAILRSILTLASNTPEVPTDFWKAPNYSAANDIERILYEVYKAYMTYVENKKTAIDDAKAVEIDYYDRAQKSWIYSAEVFSGEI